AFAGTADGEVVLDHQLHQLAPVRAVAPEDFHLLRQGGEKPAPKVELAPTGPVEAHDDLADVTDLPKMLEDILERGAFQLAVETGQHQRDGTALGIFRQRRFDGLKVVLAETMERG